MQSIQVSNSTQQLGKIFSCNILSINYSILGLLLIVDQLLLPMLSIGSVPFKISYFILGIWQLHWLLKNKKRRDVNRDIIYSYLVFLLIISCICLGEILLVSLYSVENYYEAIRVIITYILVVLSFGLGRSINSFSLEILIKILFAALFLNFIFIIFKNDLPSWLINLYYPERALTKDMNELGIMTIQDLLELARPRGLSGNPNASMLIVNIIVLFIHLSLRNRLLEIKSNFITFILIIFPPLLALILGSRGEFIVSMTLGVLNYQIFRKNMGIFFKKIFIGISVFTVILIVIVSTQIESEVLNFESLNRVISILSNQEDSDSSIARPLNQLTLFWQRFSSSPIFGAGISAASAPGFDQGTQHFHNDLLMLLATTGVIGVTFFILLLLRFAWPIGWPILIPFVLPGLVNTFVLNIPVLMFYFFMIGILRSQLKNRASNFSK